MRAQDLLLRQIQKPKAAPDAGPAKRFFGLYRAVCADNNDPEKLGRIRMEHPLIWGPGMKNLSPWAWPKNMPMAGGHCHRNADGTVEVQGDMGTFMVPEEGSPVWVEFEAGDPSYPVYSTGYWGGSAEGMANDPTVKPAMTPSESKLLCPEQYPCFGDLPRTCIDCEDLLQHGVTDSYDDIEHRPYHDHRAGKAYCPRLRTIAKTETGHSLLADDKDGREFLALIDRSGQCFTMKCRILPELQIGQWADGAMKGNMIPRGMRIMDRKTEGIVNTAADGPAAFPTVDAQAVLDTNGITQADVITALDGLTSAAAKAVLEGTPLGNTLNLLGGVTVGGVPLTPGGVFSAFAGGAAKAARDAVTSAMKAVGTSPQALLSSAMATFGIPGILSALPAPISAVLSAVGSVASILSGVFPTVLAPALVGSAYDGFDPRMYCVDQHASMGFRDLARGWMRLETAAVIDMVQAEGASAGSKPWEAAALGSLGLTQAALGEAMAVLSMPAVRAALQGTQLGSVLNTISSLSLGGIPLTPAAVFSSLTNGASEVVRKSVSNLLNTAGLSPMKLLDSLKAFSITPSFVTALSGIPGIGSLANVVAGTVGLGALGSVLSVIPGASLLGAPLAALGFMGVFSLWGFFPSAGTEIGEKAIIWRSDRDLMRHQSIAIDHAPGQEKMIFSGLNLDGEQVGPQVVLDSLAIGRFTVIDSVSGSFENFECSTGGSKEAFYQVGRTVGMNCNDVLTVGGDWLVMVGFPTALVGRNPIDVLPLLEEKALLAPQAVGGAPFCGAGNILNSAILSWTRWAGLNIFDYATLNYDRVVGGEESIDVGGSETVTIGEDQEVNVGSGQSISVGLDRTLDVLGYEMVNVLGLRSVNVGLSLSHNVGLNMSNVVGLLYNVVAGLYGTNHAGLEYKIKAGVKVSLMGGCPLIPGWQAGPSSVETKETVEAKVVEPTTYPICIWKDGVPTASATAFATA
ncbi:MAG: phage baseplate assembly protein V [Chlamydiota bacterium]